MLNITICLGSSCYLRGNDKNLETIKNLLERYPTKSNIEFKGQLCSDKCNKGPVIELNGDVYENVLEENVVVIMEKYLSACPQ